ncbi:hypothetical protein GCM10028857_26930 [Salinarchaeum chitinilyticum]
MSKQEPEMAKLKERDYEVLQTMREGRANPLLIRERTALDKGDVNTVLVRLGRSGYVEQITRGLYEITDKGRGELRAVRENRESWIFHEEVTESDLEIFPQEAGKLDQENEYYAWLLLGVTDDDRAYYFDKVEEEIVEVVSDDEDLVEVESHALGEVTHGGSVADRMTNYMLVQKDQREWDRWSRYSLAISFAHEMGRVARNFLTTEERIGYSFRVVFDLDFFAVMAFLGLGSATTDEFSRAALDKMESSQELREWIDDLGLPLEAEEKESIR